MDYLNLGCGTRFHPEWVNLDLGSTDPSVQTHDLRLGLPFVDKQFDFVYHSHLLEHFAVEAAEDFLCECYRVLKHNGIIRVVVPDLEQIVRLYLQSLEQIQHDHGESESDYRWIMLELYDQTVRERPGGAMIEYLKQDPIPNEAFVYGRIGGEARKIMHILRAQLSFEQKKIAFTSRLKIKIKNFPRSVHTKIVKLLLGQEDYSALQIGRFRMSGEIHKWMYDCYSLSQLLEKCGFKNITRRTEVDSYLANWSIWNLDTESDGTVYKPDSLFIEAVKMV